MPTLCGNQDRSQRLVAANLWINQLAEPPTLGSPERAERSSAIDVQDNYKSIAHDLYGDRTSVSCRNANSERPGCGQSSAPMLRVCRALRRASRTTSSENIWLYLCWASTGLVRCSRDFSVGDGPHHGEQLERRPSGRRRSAGHLALDRQRLDGQRRDQRADLLGLAGLGDPMDPFAADPRVGASELAPPAPRR